MLGVVARSKHPRGTPCAVHQHHQSSPQHLGFSNTREPGKFSQLGEHTAFVRERHGVGWVLERWEFECGSHEGATQTGGVNRTGRYGAKDGFELLARVGFVARYGLEPDPEVVAGALQIRGDQVVFAGKMTVKTHFGDARFGNDSVNADGTVAVGIEQVGGGLEDALAGFDEVGWGVAHIRAILHGIIWADVTNDTDLSI
jgi:hypothetical protein